jgi:hypothetical protein
LKEAVALRSAASARPTIMDGPVQMPPFKFIKINCLYVVPFGCGVALTAWMRRSSGKLLYNRSDAPECDCPFNGV